jgi:hypothetical protein
VIPLRRRQWATASFTSLVNVVAAGRNQGRGGSALIGWRMRFGAAQWRQRLQVERQDSTFQAN